MRFDQLASMTDGRLLNDPAGERRFTGVSIDSRTLNRGELFVALRGERTDGHKYIDQAIERGAAGIVAEQSFDRLDQLQTVPVVAVDDSHEAMIRLAAKYRDQVNPKRIGITGSNGKTTTKELTWALLNAVESNVFRSPGNYNNLYGMPLALLAMSGDTNVAVLEMGISMPGEMTKLAGIVRPDVMVVTNVGPSHLEFLRSVEGVARAKLEAVKTMRDDQPLIVNADDKILLEAASEIRDSFVTFGLDADADFTADAIDVTSGGTRVTIEGHVFNLPLFGRYQVFNLLAAYAAVRTLGYSFENVDTEAISFTTAPMRGETKVSRDVTFIVDCYNANPDSVRQGLIAFAEREHDGRRVIILGDMLELGEASEELHREAGRQLAELQFDYAGLFGPECRFVGMELINAGVSYEKFDQFVTVKAGLDFVVKKIKSGDLVYIKGSRGIGLEAILERWESTEGRT